MAFRCRASIPTALSRASRPAPTGRTALSWAGSKSTFPAPASKGRGSTRGGCRGKDADRQVRSARLGARPARLSRDAEPAALRHRRSWMDAPRHRRGHRGGPCEDYGNAELAVRMGGRRRPRDQAMAKQLARPRRISALRLRRRRQRDPRQRRSGVPLPRRDDHVRPSDQRRRARRAELQARLARRRRRRARGGAGQGAVRPGAGAGSMSAVTRATAGAAIRSKSSSPAFKSSISSARLSSYMGRSPTALSAASRPAPTGKPVRSSAGWKSICRRPASGAHRRCGLQQRIPPVPVSATQTDKFDLLGSARARLGYLPWPSVLLYGTGGLAWTRLEQTVTWVHRSVGNDDIDDAELAIRMGCRRRRPGAAVEHQLARPRRISALRLRQFRQGSPRLHGQRGSWISLVASGLSTGHLTTDVVRLGVDYKLN